MNLYRICRAVYAPIRGQSPWHTVGFETVCLLRAQDAEHALQIAKFKRIPCPIVEPAREVNQRGLQ